MRTLSSFDPRLQAQVSHVSDESQAVKIIQALADCTPAHALMELVRNQGFDLAVVTTAYKHAYSNRKSWVGWSLAGAEQEEFEFERQYDI
jgi:hypothetical protein